MPRGRSPKPSSGLGLDHVCTRLAGIEPNDSADAALVDRLRAGDADAFADIVRAWSPMMLRVARTYVSTDASAQEVVQDAWLAIIRGLDRFEGRSSLRTWALAILGNLGRSRGVREARTVPLSSLGPTDDDRPLVDPDRFRGPGDQWPRHWTPLGQPRPWPGSPEEAVLAGEGRSELEHGLAQLPERQRTVVTLRDIHGLTSEEVCSILGVSASNQRVLLHRARSRLRSHLELYYSANATAIGS
jgi:RNA polymerase sigma-70 factor, ECF subfamily